MSYVHIRIIIVTHGADDKYEKKKTNISELFRNNLREADAHDIILDRFHLNL